VRVMGPAVSWLWEMGMMPARLTRPTVGFRPTRPQMEEGLTMDPSVSVPMAAAQRLAAAAAADPELDPLVVRARGWGVLVRPAGGLQPLVEREERMLAHSLRLVLPSRTAPAARRRAATWASRGAGAPSSASEPAVVCVRSPVSMLSLRRIGTPCKGP